MARTKAQVDRPDFVEDPDTDPDMELLTTAPDEWEFDTIAEEAATRILFEKSEEKYGKDADKVILQYTGREHVEQEPDKDGRDQSFDLFLFKGRDDKPYSLNVSYKLEEAMKEVNVGDWLRITYVKDLPTARGLNPMKDLRVERKRS